MGVASTGLEVSPERGVAIGAPREPPHRRTGIKVLLLNGSPGDRGTWNATPFAAPPSSGLQKPPVALRPEHCGAL